MFRVEEENIQKKVKAERKQKPWVIKKERRREEIRNLRQEQRENETPGCGNTRIGHEG